MRLRLTPAPYEKAQASDVICKRAAQGSELNVVLDVPVCMLVYTHAPGISCVQGSDLDVSQAGRNKCLFLGISDVPAHMFLVHVQKVPRT